MNFNISKTVYSTSSHPITSHYRGVRCGYSAWFQKISIPTEEGEVSKAKIPKGKCDPNLEFPDRWGGGGSIQKPSVGGVWTFFGTPHSQAATSPYQGGRGGGQGKKRHRSANEAMGKKP